MIIIVKYFLSLFQQKNSLIYLRTDPNFYNKANALQFLVNCSLFVLRTKIKAYPSVSEVFSCWGYICKEGETISQSLKWFSLQTVHSCRANKIEDLFYHYRKLLFCRTWREKRRILLGKKDKGKDDSELGSMTTARFQLLLTEADR